MLRLVVISGEVGSCLLLYIRVGDIAVWKISFVIFVGWGLGVRVLRDLFVARTWDNSLLVYISIAELSDSACLLVIAIWACISLICYCNC